MQRHTCLLVLLLMPSLTACISSTRENDFPRATLTGAASPPPIETSATEYDFHLDGGKMVTSHFVGKSTLSLITNRWESQDVISHAEYRKNEKWEDDTVDSRVVMSGTRVGHSSILLQIISGLSLMLIPYVVDSVEELEFKRKNLSTGEVTTARAKIRDYKLVSLLFLPFAPFTLAGDMRQSNMLADSVYCQLWEEQNCEFTEPESKSWGETTSE